MTEIEHSKRQTCECGNDSYHINSTFDGDEMYILVSCAECGRITNTLGTELFHGMDYDALTGGEA